MTSIFDASSLTIPASRTIVFRRKEESSSSSKPQDVVIVRQNQARKAGINKDAIKESLDQAMDVIADLSLEEQVPRRRYSNQPLNSYVYRSELLKDDMRMFSKALASCNLDDSDDESDDEDSCCGDEDHFGF